MHSICAIILISIRHGSGLPAKRQFKGGVKPNKEVIMDFYKYIDEINLIENQNNTERDLYYLVKQPVINSFSKAQVTKKIRG